VLPLLETKEEYNYFNFPWPMVVAARGRKKLARALHTSGSDLEL
jgi:hypothetical protein